MFPNSLLCDMSKANSYFNALPFQFDCITRNLFKRFFHFWKIPEGLNMIKHGRNPWLINRLSTES